VKNTEILELSDKELQERLDNEKDYLSRLRLNHAISPLDNPQKIVESRRNVARLITELNRRKREIQQESEKS
jgi:large subunit ribosomal protein L29